VTRASERHRSSLNCRRRIKGLDGIRKPIGEEELARARNYVALRYPTGFETTGQLAAKLEEKALFNCRTIFLTPTWTA
jgi:hypothetical protein